MPSGDNTAEQDKVRELQVKLYLAAKRSPERRFHALWDRIHRRDVLQRAWQQVRENRGAPGVDRITITESAIGLPSTTLTHTSIAPYAKVPRAVNNTHRR